jgi:tetratricopeptide (TPR) repeat protein
MSEIKKETTEHSSIENVGQALSKAEQFIEKNSKIITIVAVAIFVIVGGYFGYKKWYLLPLEKEAHTQMFVAEQYFEKDSFYLALNGDGNNWGFLKIIDEYSGTKASKLSHYYAGICYLHTGKFQKAVDQLEDFSSNDKLIAPVAIGAKGDAYSELGKKDKALEAYLDAAKNYENDFTSPIYLMKAGIVSEALNNYKQALEAYTIIKDKYPRSYEGRQIDKFITRAQLMVGNK